ncbi:sulfurtransferase TusA family protein [Neiella sp. HB171785]|uniref:Sulfurtransferase TusA family protein n=1 Tax=Neiella litorisoli TaxID=2771431 RepID=A0A8J6UIY6_9GAMM|nr:sulfurtransferase TusA family protein [Neiella litorisoli]MBD1389463.1 sulfurtransferase TusA family protein [Neiella litorisoli]
MNPVLFNALHLVCPEFQIQMRRHLAKQPVGQLVHIQTKAPNAERDVRLYAAHSNHKVVACQKEQTVTHIMVKIGAS